MSDTFEPDWCVHPGAMLREIIADRPGVRAVVLTELTWLRSEDLDDLLAGERPLRDEDAEALGRVFSTSPQFWRNLETNFREGLAAGKTWTNREP